MSLRSFLLYRAFKKFSHSTAIYDLDRAHKVSYQDYFSHTIQLEKLLRMKYQIKPGDYVGLALQNSIEYLYIIMALNLRRATAVHFNYKFPPKLIENLLCNNCITFFITDQYNTLLTEEHPFPNCIVIRLDLLLNQLTNNNLSINKIDHHQYSFPSMGEQANVIFTSASTGPPKGVIHSYKNHYYSALGLHKNIQLTCRDAWLLSLPLFHIAGLSILYRMLLVGGQVVLTRNIENMIGHPMITYISMVVTQFMRLSTSCKVYIGTTRTKIFIGGSSVPSAIIEQAKQYNIVLYHTYGSSEMSSQVANTSPQQTKMYTSGVKVLPFRMVCTNSDQEIYVKGPVLCMGYLQNSHFFPITNTQGWFCSGDLGYFDHQKTLVITGRKDNMFISKGENIQPEEIEAILQDMDSILVATVVPVIDKESMYLPVAFLQIDGDQLNTILPSIHSHLMNNLPSIKHPIHYFVFPANVSNSRNMKINRKELIKLAEKYLQ